MAKLSNIRNLAYAEAGSVSSSPQDWMCFMDTASRMYRYSFLEQLLIYAQRPEATACAALDTWNQKVGRWVNRGAKGIALIDDTAQPERLRYVFDIADTHAVRGAPDPYIWRLEDRHKDWFLAYLSGTYNLSDVSSIMLALEQVAEQVTDEYIEDAMDAYMTDVEGKIVLMQGRAKPDLFEKLQKKGALGYISLGGNMYEDESIKNELRPSNAFGKNNPLPGLRIHISQAEQLVLSKPTKVKMTLKSETKKATAHNVVATIEGTDLKNEVLCFSAHCDSVPYSKGSWDNATGSVAIAELMHYFKEKGSRRTLKFVWCGAEEIGLVGSREYCKKHEAELKDYIFNINFDMTGVTIGYEKCCCSTSEETMHAIEYMAKLNNYPLNIELGTYASDSTSFAGAGVPACSFARLQAMGGAQIHNHNDTMERLDPDSFMITQEFVAKFAEQLANAPVNPIPRKFADVVAKKLEEGKKMRAAMEAKEKEEKKEEKAEEKKEETK